MRVITPVAAFVLIAAAPGGSDARSTVGEPARHPGRPGSLPI